VITAIALYLITIWRFAINLPYADVYDVVLGFLNNFSQLDPHQKLLSLLSQHNEHRLTFNRLVEPVERPHVLEAVELLKT
jgi:hypothetical protein